MLRERAGEIDARQAALVDEDLADAATRRALHLEGALELGAGDEPELDEDLADRPPGVLTGASSGTAWICLELPLLGVHPTGIGTEASKVQRQTSARPDQSSPGCTTPFS